VGDNSPTDALQSVGVTDDIADGIEHELDPRWITLARRQNWLRFLGTTPFWILVVGGGLFAATLPEWIERAIPVALGVKILFSAIRAHVWPPVQYRYASYKVDQLGIQVRGGVWRRMVTSVPRSRVQHIDLAQGFHERRLGLASLTIHTAARGNAEVNLSGASMETATRIRDFLLPQERGDAV
jgi:membrane protein YdbS with pleckstrin-like domain